MLSVCCISFKIAFTTLGWDVLKFGTYSIMLTNIFHLANWNLAFLNCFLEDKIALHRSKMKNLLVSTTGIVGFGPKSLSKCYILHGDKKRGLMVMKK